MNKSSAQPQNRRIRAITTLLSVSLSLVSVQALAQQSMDSMNQSPFKTEFDKLDIDHDGTLSKKELAHDHDFSGKKFAHADSDQDGTLDLDEYASGKTQAQQKRLGRVVDDSAITTKVKSKLVADAGLKSLSISVETMHGEVILSGFVDTDANKDTAEKITKSVEGVKSVKNALVVKN